MTEPTQIQALSIGHGQYKWTYTSPAGKVYTRQDNDSQSFDRIVDIKVNGLNRGDKTFLNNLAKYIKRGRHEKVD